MRITLSAAVTADGFLDDRTPRRLIVSTPEDWAEVHRLRAAHDAIMVGAETLRRDDPVLLIRDEALRARRAAAGMSPDIARVSLTASGRLDPWLRFFAADGADRYLFARCELPALASRAAVIRSDEPLTARYVVTELEKRGIRSLFVEGGASVLRLFLDEGLADTLRLAVNPSLRVGALGGAAFAFVPPEGVPCRYERFGGMEVATCTLHRDTTQEDLLLLRRAVAESRRCVPSDSCYRVGAVVATCDGRQFTGYTHETSSTHHAEQEAIAKALAAGAELRGAAIYSSMEPCSTRRSEPESCSTLIVRHGFARAVFALYEPDRFAACRGALDMRAAGVDVRCYPELAAEVRAINAHVLKA